MNNVLWLLKSLKMTEKQSSQLKLAVTKIIENFSIFKFENWFKYPVKVHPHHTDYGGVVWHGSYIAWMEEARGECLHSIGIEIADLVALGCDLPVVELSVRYHRAIQLGMTVVVKTCISKMTGVRIDWDYAIVSTDGQQLYTTAKINLVAIDRQRGKIMRHLPASVKDAFAKISVLYK